MANNIIKRIWNQNKMVQIEDLKGMAFQAEDGGHTFEIYGIDEEGETVSLTGTPSGVFLRPDNTDVVLDCSVSDGVVSATLPDECYDVPGRGGLTVFITADGKKTALYAAVVTVSRTSSGNVAPPATQTVVDLVNAISAAVATIPASYSALMADIAPTYSDSALYAVGQYAWYNGDLKRCIVPITTAESYTAAHWTSAVLGNDVSDLKSAIEYLSEPTENLLNIFTMPVTNFFPNGSTQKLATASTVKSVVVPVDSDNGTTVYIYKGINSRFCLTTLSSANPSSGDSYISNSYKAGTDTEATVTIDSSVKAILIWFYDTSYQSDASKDPVEILQSITVLYGSTGGFVRSLNPYGLYDIDKPNLTDDTTKEYTTVELSKYSTSNKAGSSLYINDKVFPNGFINKATVRVNGESEKTVNVLFIHPITHSILRWYKATGVGVFDITIGEYMPVDFILGVQGENATFKSANYSVYGINWKDIGVNTFNTLKCGDVIDFSFPERTASTTCYYLGCDLQYTSMKGVIYRPHNIYTHNKMYAVGDSITAGYQHYTEGIHWWETVGRALGYEVTPGAQSGAGISYYTSGKNACKYAHDVDFAPYNVAVFAFGTNDYGNNIQIGTMDDPYTYSEDSSQTFYACLKYIVETVKTKNPKCTLIFSLPINRIRGTIANRYAYGYENGVGKTLNDYCDAIVAVCNHYCIPYLDHRKGAFDLYSLSTLLEDGLHPTDDGYKVLGQEMTAMISAIKQPYAEYSGVGGWIHG